MRGLKYCDDARCPNFHGDELEGEDCSLGFPIKFRPPESYADIMACNWGWKMVRACQNKFKRRSKNGSIRKRSSDGS